MRDFRKKKRFIAMLAEEDDQDANENASLEKKTP